jgi:hypothetical protein
MSERPNVEMHGFGSLAVLVLFWVFYMQSGWYRLDCALGTQRACELIAAEYAAKAKP